jgi:hypothetical protein
MIASPTLTLKQQLYYRNLEQNYPRLLKGAFGFHGLKKVFLAGN